MARPRKAGMSYFSHDTDAANDEKIEAMRALFGNDGYSFYFILLERIYRSENAEIDISKPVFKATLIQKLLIDGKKFDEMLESAFDVQLFDRQAFEERGVITSKGIQKRAGVIQEKRDRWRNSKVKKEGDEDSEEDDP